MKINKAGSLIGLSAVLLLGPLGAVQAQAPGVYVGGSWGAYSIKKSSLDENDNVLKAVVGAQFNNWFSLEGSWIDFNSANSGSETFEADGKGLAALFSMPVGKTSLAFVKFGEFWWSSDSLLGGSLGASKGNDPFYGVGFKFGFNDHLSLRTELERFDVADANIKALTVGLELKF